MNFFKVSLMLFEQQVAWIDAYAEQLDVSRSYVVRLLLRWVFSKPPSIVELLSIQRAAQRHGGVAQ